MYKLPPGVRAVLEVHGYDKYHLEDCPTDLIHLMHQAMTAIHNSHTIVVLTVDSIGKNEVCLVMAYDGPGGDRMIGGWNTQTGDPINPVEFVSSTDMRNAVADAIRWRRNELRGKYETPVMLGLAAVYLIVSWALINRFAPGVDTAYEWTVMTGLLLAGLVVVLFTPRDIMRQKVDKVWAADKEAQEMEALPK